MWVVTRLALLLCSVCFIVCTEIPKWGYIFVNKNLTWSEAQQFCRQHYHDLACVSTPEDNLRLPRPPDYSAPVWIGFYDDPTDLDQWKWVPTNSNGSFKSWGSEEPKYIHQARQCSVVFKSKWSTAPCTSVRPALCHSGSKPKSFHMIGRMNWKNAMTTCRRRYTDLAFIENAEENTAASAAGAGQYAYISLYRGSGKWSDKRKVGFLLWNKPDSKFYKEPICAAENVKHTWEAFSCQERRAFYCQDEPKRRNVVKIMFSGQNLDDSAINKSISEKIQKMFEAASRPDVKIIWMTTTKN